MRVGGKRVYASAGYRGRGGDSTELQARPSYPLCRRAIDFSSSRTVGLLILFRVTTVSLSVWSPERHGVQRGLPSINESIGLARKAFCAVFGGFELEGGGLVDGKHS